MAFTVKITVTQITFQVWTAKTGNIDHQPTCTLIVQDQSPGVTF